MQASTVASNTLKLARAVLSPDPLTRNSFLNTYASSSVTHTSPISSIKGLSHVKAALEVHNLFKKDVDVLDVSWDEAARVVVIDAETTWSSPVFSLVRTKSYGKTKIRFKEFEEDEGDGAVGGDQRSDGKGGRLVITEIQEDDSMDVSLARRLPGFVLNPLIAFVSVILPALGNIVFFLSHQYDRNVRVASRRPSGLVPALLNPLDTAHILFANALLFGSAVTSWLVSSLDGFATNILPWLIIETNAFEPGSSKRNIAPAASKKSTPQPSQSSATLPGSAGMDLSSNPVPGETYAAAAHKGQEEDDKVEKHGETTTQGQGTERYPHHEEVVEGLSFSSALKSGVEGLDDRVAAV